MLNDSSASLLQLKTTHSPSNMQLVVTRMNQTLPSSPEVVSVASAFNLASLANIGFTIGGQNPDVRHVFLGVLRKKLHYFYRAIVQKTLLIFISSLSYRIVFLCL